MVVFSGKNFLVSFFRWPRGGVKSFRSDYTYIHKQLIWETYQYYLTTFGERAVVFGFNDYGLEYLPAPPINSVTVNTEFGVAPYEAYGRIFAFDFKPAPIGGRNINVMGMVSSEFFADLLSLVVDIYGTMPFRRRRAAEATPEYGIQLTAVPLVPEYADYRFIIETDFAIPTQVTIRGDTNNPILTFDATYFTPYASWYYVKALHSPTYDLPIPPYSFNIVNIRDIQVSIKSFHWTLFLDFIYGFNLTIRKSIETVYTHPFSYETEVGYPAITFPFTSYEWTSVTQSIKEGSVSINLSLTAGLPSDANLFLGSELGDFASIYNFTRLSFPVIIRFGNYWVLEATAQVVSLNTSLSPNNAFLIVANLILTDPIALYSP